MKFCINGTHEFSQKKNFVVLLFLEAPNSYRYYFLAIYIFHTSFTKHDPSLIFFEDDLPI